MSLRLFEIPFVITGCKYTKYFFLGKWFYKNNFKSFCYLCSLNLYIMFHRTIKLVFAALLIVAGIWQMTENNIGNGIFLVLLSALPILLYFKNEFIILAFLRLRKQDFPGAQKWLSKISNPETALVKKQQGYYNYLHGIMLSQTNMLQAEKYFKKAIELGLSMDTDLAVAKLNLAGVAMTRRRKIEATNLLNEAKKLDKHNMLKDQITMMKDQLKKM
jgi:tetratricopeptide (TPR) repeat protein